MMPQPAADAGVWQSLASCSTACCIHQWQNSSSMCQQWPKLYVTSSL